MKVPGFILIELLVSLLIASLLSIGMMNSLTLVFKTNETMDALMDVSATAMRLQQVLERDLSGVTIPLSFQETKEDAAEAQKLPIKQEGKKGDGDAKKQDDGFIAVKKDLNTQFITFITTNPLASFWSDTAGQVQSRLVRVVYRLEPVEKVTGLFKLMRQEGLDLNLASYEKTSKKPIRALEVASGIRDFSMEFLAEAVQQQKNAGGDGKKDVVNQQPQPLLILESFDIWDSRVGEPKKKSPYPLYVKLKMTFLDQKTKKETFFEYVFSIKTDDKPFVKKKKQPEKKEQSVPSQGGIRARLAQSKNKPKAAPGGLLAQFTQKVGVRA